MIEQEQTYYKTLQKLQAELFDNINNDIIKIFNILEIIKENPDNVNSMQRVLPLSHFKTIKVTKRKSQQHDLLLEIHNNILVVTSGFYSIYLDINLLNHLLLSMYIPNYINYQISINDKIIAFKGQESNIANTVKTTINPSLIITTELFIDANYISQIKWSWIHIQIRENIFIIVSLFLVNWIYFRFNVRPIIDKYQSLKSSNLDLAEENKLLSNYLNTKNSYDKLMILSVRQMIRNIEMDQIPLLGNALYYPLLVNHKRNTIIDNEELDQELRAFFQYRIYKKEIEFCNSTKDKQFTVNISKESFYQLIFSLISNVISLLEEKSFFELQFKVENNILYNITIVYIGFKLSLEQMVTYLSKKNYDDIFLLDIDRIIEGFKLYGFTATVQCIQDGKNIISKNIMQFEHQDKSDNETKNNIINIKDYSNK